MKRIVFIAALLLTIATVAVTVSWVFKPVEAQRSVTQRFDYALINGSYFPYPADGPTVVSAAVNICYIQQNGCQNEEIRTEVGIAKFAQDERLDNNPRVKALAQQRAVEIAFSRAISKLGADGWEIIDSPAVEFDLVYTNQQGVQTVKEGNKSTNQNIWFRRSRQ